jgi:hypothetical protein
VPWHFGLHAAPNGAGICGVMPSYKHIAPPEQRPGVTDRLFVQSPSKVVLSIFAVVVVLFGGVTLFRYLPIISQNPDTWFLSLGYF